MEDNQTTLANNVEYKNWLIEIKQKVASSQMKAAVKVNTELLMLYWELGKEIIRLQQQASWGDKFLTQLSKDLTAEFPEIKGFSKRNLEQIRRWFLFWEQDPVIAKQAVSQLVEIPWGHNIQIVTKSKDNVVVEYALSDIQKPMGIAEYRLTKELPQELQDDLPSIEKLVQLGEQHKEEL